MGVWQDDKQIDEPRARKCYGERDEIRIVMEPIQLRAVSR